MSIPDYTDVYRNIRYVIKFFKHENGITTEIHIQDLPVIKDSDRLYQSRDSAVISTVNVAEAMISKSLA